MSFFLCFRNLSLKPGSLPSRRSAIVLITVMGFLQLDEVCVCCEAVWAFVQRCVIDGVFGATPCDISFLPDDTTWFPRTLTQAPKSKTPDCPEPLGPYRPGSRKALSTRASKQSHPRHIIEDVVEHSCLSEKLISKPANY